MKTRLHKTLFFSAFTLFAMQAVSAQYVGVPFPDKTMTPQIGADQNVATRIELENFDSVEDGTGFYIDGINTGHTSTSPPVTGTYNDKSAGSGGNNTTYRPAADVDIDDDGTGQVLTGIQGQEYTLHTIQILHDGDYDFTVSYRINSGVGSKNLQVFLRDGNDLTPEGTLYNGALAVGTGAYEDLNFTATSLTAGNYVLFVRYVSAGPRFDYIDITRTSVLSVEENKLKASTFKAFPNPANGGQFKLNIETKWNVYNLLGAKLLEGEGKTVDLSSFAKGSYILKTPFTSKMLISK